jgi:hypothetical protein
VSELHHHDSIAAIIARPPEAIGPREISVLKASLIAGAAVLSEGEIYNRVARLLRSDPHAANDMLLAMDQGDDAFDPAWMDLRVHLLAAAYTRMKELAAAEAPHVFDTGAEKAGGPADQAREAAFRADPGKYLPGATTSAVRLLRPSGFGLVEIDGETFAWTYSALGYARSEVAELSAFIADAGQGYRGVIVGPAGLWSEIDLPQGWKLVAVELGGSNGGRAA